MTMSDRDLDALLDEIDPRPPRDFVARVMHAVADERATPIASPDARAAPRPRLVRSAAARRAPSRLQAWLATAVRYGPRLLRWCLIGAGGAFGVAQSASFGLGLWLATAVG